MKSTPVNTVIFKVADTSISTSAITLSYRPLPVQTLSPPPPTSMGTKRSWEGQPVPLHQKPDDTMSSSKPGSSVQSIFETFRDELDEHHDRRERIIKASRDITALSKKMYPPPSLEQTRLTLTQKLTNSCLQYLRAPTRPRNQPTAPRKNRLRKPNPPRPDPQALHLHRTRCAGNKRLALPAQHQRRDPRVHRSNLIRPLPPHTDTDHTRRGRSTTTIRDNGHRGRFPDGTYGFDGRDHAICSLTIELG